MSRSAPAVRAKLAEEAARRRRDQQSCAADFLFRGDPNGTHAGSCVFPPHLPPCSRDYDPGPVPEDVKLYEGSHLGALWGLNTLESWQLAGWTITRHHRPRGRS